MQLKLPVSKLQEFYSWAEWPTSSLLPCSLFVKHKKNKSGKERPSRFRWSHNSICSNSLLQAVCFHSTLLWTLHLKMIRHAGFGWTPTPVTWGRHHSLFQKARGVNRSLACHSLFSQGGEREQTLLLLRFNTCQLAHFSSEKDEQGGEVAENGFLLPLIAALLPVRIQSASVGIFPEMTREQKVMLRQVEVPPEISWHWNAKPSVAIWISYNSYKDLRYLASLK